METKIFSSESVNKSNVIFCGLVSGYQGEGNTATPENAAEAVAEELKKLGSEVCVKPAVCVYHTDWGCPKGGEPVGAFVLSGKAQEILATSESLRKALKQSTLSVGLVGVGSETLGFEAEVEGVILEIGALWQEAAAEQMAVTGTYVSCGIAETGDGKATISAEANPAFVQNLDAWKSIVETICSKVGAQPRFMQIGFNYLQNAE